MSWGQFGVAPWGRGFGKTWPAIVPLGSQEVLEGGRYPPGRTEPVNPSPAASWAGKGACEQMNIPATLNAMWRLSSGSPLQVEAFAGGENAAASRSSGEAPTDHRSSRKPLKKGCRTLPSADMARYSISANNFECPCGRRASRRAASSGSAASAASAGRWRRPCRSHGRPCRRSSARRPCVGQGRYRLIHPRRARSRRWSGSPGPRRSSSPNCCRGR